MTPQQLIELALAAVLLVAGIWLYRRPSVGPDGQVDQYGSQGAVLLFILALILAIHGLGLMEYRPSAAEKEELAQ